MLFGIICPMVLLVHHAICITRPTPSPYRDFRRHAVPPPPADWEAGLREATYQALIREHHSDPSLHETVAEAPIVGRQDSAVPFGDITILARGQLYANRAGYLKFVQDPYQNDCEDCHNERLRCAPSQCHTWGNHDGEQMIALWTVKRIRHRDHNYGHRYEMEYTVTPVGGNEEDYDYNTPGHVFIVRGQELNFHHAPSPQKPGFPIGAGTDGFRPIYPNAPGLKTTTNTYNTGTTQVPHEKEVDLYKKLINTLALKTTTPGQEYSQITSHPDIFDASFRSTTAKNANFDIFDVVSRGPVTFPPSQTKPNPFLTQRTTYSTAPTEKTTYTTVPAETTYIFVPTDQITPVTESVVPQYTTSDRKPITATEPIHYHTTIYTEEQRQITSPVTTAKPVSKTPVTSITYFTPVEDTENYSTVKSATRKTTPEDDFDIFSDVRLQTKTQQTTSPHHDEVTVLSIAVTEDLLAKNHPSTESLEAATRQLNTVTTRKEIVSQRTDSFEAPTTRQSTSTKAHTKISTTSPTSVKLSKVESTPKPVPTTTEIDGDLSGDNASESVEEHTRSSEQNYTDGAPTSTTSTIGTTDHGSTIKPITFRNRISTIKTNATDDEISSTTSSTSSRDTTESYETTTSDASRNKNAFTGFRLENNKKISTTEKNTPSTQKAIEIHATTTDGTTKFNEDNDITTEVEKTTNLHFKSRETATEITEKPSISTEAATKTTPVHIVTPLSTKPTLLKTIDEKIVADIFGEDKSPSTMKPQATTNKQITNEDEFLFGLQTTTPTTPKIIFENFFEASTASSIEDKSVAETESQEDAPQTRLSFITSTSFEINGRNVSTTAAPTTMVKATVTEIQNEDAKDFKVFKAEMPRTTTEELRAQKKVFDDLALSLVNHARSIDILNGSKNSTRERKYTRRRSYVPRSTKRSESGIN